MKKAIHFLNILLIAGALALSWIALETGCVRTIAIDTQVDSIADPAAKDKHKYVLLPGNKDTNPDDLQFKEFARYVEDIMRDKGFVRVEAADADIMVFLLYGIGDPQTHLSSYAVPIWGQTGYQSSRTTGSITSYGNNARFSGTTTYTPSYGVTGVYTGVKSYTSFTRYLILDAYDVAVLKKENRLSQVWRTKAFSTGENGDLRFVFPYMALAIRPYTASNTGQIVEEITNVNDGSVQEWVERMGASH